MIFLDKTKNLRIYKKPFYLPTVEKDKKKKSVILLLTPNFESSKGLINNPLTINRLRFQSYYLQRDVSYYINGKFAKKIEEDDYVREATIEEMYQGLYEMTAAERKKLPDSAFGIPSKRKYPLDTEAHVRSAIRFFNYVSKEDEQELADNINKAIRKFNITDIKVGKNNRFYKYYKPINESAEIVEESDIETAIDNLSSFIAFSGYYKDVDKIKDIITPSFYYEMTQKLELPVKTLKDIPILMVNVGTDSKDTINYESGDYKVYPVSVNNLDTVKKDVYAQFINHLAPRFEGTVLTDILTDHLLSENKGFRKQYADYLFNEKGIGVNEFLNTSLLNVFGILREKFNIKPEELDATIVTENGYVGFDNTVGDLDSSIFTESDINDAGGVRIDDVVYFLDESKADDSNLKRLLYAERFKNRTDILEILNGVKEAIPAIKYAFPDITKYQSKNIFFDLYYYNELFFKNNTMSVKKSYSTYLVLLDRFINNPIIKQNGYTKKTIFIPILDWNMNRKTRMWLYRENFNPISIIYDLMYTESSQIKNIFKDTDIIFFGADKYFRINFSEIEDMKQAALKFKLFVNRIVKNEDFTPEDEDTSMDNNVTTRVARTNLVDAIDMAKGVDLTKNVADAEEWEKDVEKNISNQPHVNPPKAKGPVKPTATKAHKVEVVPTNTPNKEINKNIKDNNIKLAKDVDKDKLMNQQQKLDAISKKIVLTTSAIDDVKLDIDNVMNSLDNDDEFKDLLNDISDINSDDTKVDMSSTRAARMSDLNEKFLKSSVQGKTVEQILNTSFDKEIKTTTLNISTPSKDWSNLTYMNFDKEYDLDSDIVKSFYHFTKVSRPIAIRKMSADDVSTSEDSIIKYTAECEDYRGKRFTIKLDIPKMVDNRMRLRGNNKTIQTQLFNLPIIKTEFGTCQIVSNYKKIFISTFNNSVAGRSSAVSNAIIKSLAKCEDKNIIITTGMNIKVSNKYQLPVDYIDLCTQYSSIETPNYIFYFDQDVIKNLYGDTIDDNRGIPYGYDKVNKSIMYFTISQFRTFSMELADTLCNESKKFKEVFDAQKWTNSGTYSKCKILNTEIPLVLICAYLEGLSTTLKKANIQFELKEELPREVRNNLEYICIRFKDGYLWTKSSYEANMLLNGLKDCSTELFSITEVDDRSMYYELLDEFGGKRSAEGLDNFYDCLIDPITLEVLQHYNLPTDFVTVLLYANALLCDNKFVKHTDTSSRRIRRAEQIAAYTYQVLAEAYGDYSRALKHGRDATISIKETAVIDRIMSCPITSDDSTINALNAVETTNAVSYKGNAGLNSERSYSLDKRVYDSSMLNVLGASTGFSANVGLTRQATMNMNVEGVRGYVKQINGDTDKMNAANSLCATEAVTPFGTTHDDAMRTNMTFIQTAKHSMRTVESDPLLVTCGADEAMPYMTLDRFAFKAKKDGVIKEATDNYMIIEYTDGQKDFVNLNVTTEKNSAGGFYVPLKLDKSAGLYEGKKIKAGTVLAYDKSSFSNSLGETDNIAYNVGKLSKVAIISTDDGFEDSGFCTERLSKSLSTKVVMKVQAVVDKDCDVFSYAKVGDSVLPEDNLLMWQTKFEDEESIRLARNLSADIANDSELGKKTLKSTIAGKVVDLKIFRTVDTKELSPSLQKIVKAYEAPIIQIKKKLEEEGMDTSSLMATYKLDSTGKLKKAQEALLFEYYLEYTDRVAVGDKIVYFAANKAVIKDIIPDTLAPTTDFRRNEPIDAFVSQISIDKRLVTSTLITGSINKLLIELDRSVKDILGIKYDDSTV